MAFFGFRPSAFGFLVGAGLSLKGATGRRDYLLQHRAFPL